MVASCGPERITSDDYYDHDVILATVATLTGNDDPADVNADFPDGGAATPLTTRVHWWVPVVDDEEVLMGASRALYVAPAWCGHLAVDAVRVAGGTMGGCASAGPTLPEGGECEPRIGCSWIIPRNSASMPDPQLLGGRDRCGSPGGRR